MTLNFWRMCTANLLLFISVYMLFPLLPFVMGEQLGVSVGQAGSMFLVFVVAMFAVGPFHAYLVDEYKRKHVLLYSALIMLAAVLGYAFVDGYTKFLLLAAVQGACFGLATTAGITVAIDITTSARRSAGNMVYAWAARLGMLVGVVLGIGMYRMYGFRMVTYLSVAAGLASIFFASRVYVAFRAPIGVSLCNMDRFLLPRAWVPAINMLLIAFVPGALLPLMFVGDYWSLAAFGGFGVFIMDFHIHHIVFDFHFHPTGSYLRYHHIASALHFHHLELDFHSHHIASALHFHLIESGFHFHHIEFPLSVSPLG